jgi:hypothetical protein
MEGTNNRGRFKRRKMRIGRGGHRRGREKDGRERWKRNKRIEGEVRR